LPGLLSVHCILITADDNVICTRRSRLTAYSRECWSISFEEQLNDSDVLEYRDPISHAVLRGVKEELLLTEEEVESAACTPLAVILESNIFNFAIVCLVRIGKSAGEICNIWESRNALNPSGEVDCVEGRSLAQFMQAGNEGIRLGQNFDAELHPTSLIRLQLLRKWHGRNKD